jgi:hypothetical protein
MIVNDQQFQTILERIAWFQKQAAELRKTETNPVNYRAAVSSFLAEIDRMHFKVREYLSVLPTEGEEKGDADIICRDCAGVTIIANDQQFQTTLERIAWFHKQAAQLRNTETNPANYRAAVSGFLAEIDRMHFKVREYLSVLPTEKVEPA